MSNHSVSSSDSDSDSDGYEFLTNEYLERKVELAEMQDSEEDYFGSDMESVDPVKELEKIPLDLPSDVKTETLGDVYAVMKPFIVVEPNSTIAVLDIGSLVVCPGTRKVLGMIWDVFGPVKSPLYSVIVRPELFDTLEKGSIIQFSPDFVKVVSKEALLDERGVDADPNFPEEFSDDELESLKKKGYESGEVV